MSSFWIFGMVLLITTYSESADAEEGDNGGTHVTIQIQNVEGLTVNQVSDFKLDYADFEEKTKSYIQSAKQGNEARASDSLRFLTELGQYIAKLPKGKSTTVKFRGRLACDCNGKRMNPCPAQCLYSCFGLFETGKEWRSENDCRSKSFLECQCYRGSLDMCNAGITSCFKETTGELPGDEVCSAYSVDEDRLVQSYVLFEDLLIEPINVFIRKLESSLGFMRQTAESIGHLAKLKWLSCNPIADDKCSPGAPGLLKNQMDSYQQLKMNMAYEMIDKLKESRMINKDVIGLRERILSHVNGLLKSYACCLRNSSHNIDQIDCSAVPPLPTAEWSPLIPNQTKPQKPDVYGSYEWVPSNGSVPENAVKAGTEQNGSAFYAGRATFEGMLLPAKVTSYGTSFVSNEGKEHFLQSNFEILLSKHISWKPTTSDSAIPPGTLKVGHTKGGDPLYMGRAVVDGRNVPGKVQTNDRCLYVPYGYGERKFCSYEIMVLNKIE